MGGGFTKLAAPEHFPGAVTKVFTGVRSLRVGDLVWIEWDHIQASIGQDVQGRIADLDYKNIRGPMGLELACYITLESGWYSMGRDLVTCASFDGASPDTDDVVFSFVPTTHVADFAHKWELNTHAVPGWRVFIIGGDSDRLEELSAATGRSVEELTAGE